MLLPHWHDLFFVSRGYLHRFHFTLPLRQFRDEEIQIWLCSIKRQKGLRSGTSFSPKAFLLLYSLSKPPCKALWDGWILKIHLELGRVSSSSGETSHTTLVLLRTQLGKAKKSSNPTRKTQAGSAGCSVFMTHQEFHVEYTLPSVFNLFS